MGAEGSRNGADVHVHSRSAHTSPPVRPQLAEPTDPASNFVDLSPAASVLFASESIVGILGHQPSTLQGRSCFDFLHPDELPVARHVHAAGILRDTTAALHYLRIRSSNGRWIRCECCFALVYEVLVACVCVYQGSERSKSQSGITIIFRA